MLDPDPLGSCDFSGLAWGAKTFVFSSGGTRMRRLRHLHGGGSKLGQELQQKEMKKDQGTLVKLTVRLKAVGRDQGGPAT